MNVKFSEENGNVIIRPQGAMNALTCPAMQDEIATRLADCDSPVVLDLAGVPFISSHGLRVVIQTAKLAKENGPLTACGLQPQIQQMFKLAGLDKVVAIRENGDAVASA